MCPPEGYAKAGSRARWPAWCNSRSPSKTIGSVQGRYERSSLLLRPGLAMAGASSARTRSFHQVACELPTLLDNADIKPHFVL
jgi:hypothetical protein